MFNILIKEYEYATLYCGDIIEKILISVSIIKFAMYMKTLQFLFTTCA